MQTIARSMADTGPIEGRYMPHAPPIVGRYGKRPHSRMRRLQLRTAHDLISSPRAFAGRAAPKERLVDSADVPAPWLTARGAQALLLVSRAVGVDRQPAALGCGSGDRLRRSRLGRRGGGGTDFSGRLARMACTLLRATPSARSTSSSVTGNPASWRAAKSSAIAVSMPARSQAWRWP